MLLAAASRTRLEQGTGQAGWRGMLSHKGGTMWKGEQRVLKLMWDG